MNSLRTKNKQKTNRKSNKVFNNKSGEKTPRSYFARAIVSRERKRSEGGKEGLMDFQFAMATRIHKYLMGQKL